MKKHFFLLALAVVLALFQVSLFAQPTITSFTPSSGPIGTSVVITGTNINATAANNTVYFGAVKATVTAATATSLTVTVPAGTTYQPISVTTGGLTAYSRLPFVVTFTGGGFLNSTSFDSNLDFTTGSGPADATISDIDGDGKPDVLVTNNNVSTGTSISVLRNTTTSTISFATKVDFTTLTAPSRITTGDIDGDGKPDVVVSHGSSTIPNYVSVFRNTSTAGSISFAARQDFSVGNYGNRVVLRDFDGDGKLDLAIKASNISVLRNTSTVGVISFAAKVDYFTTLGVQDFSLGDIDGDGKVDMILFNNGPSPFSLSQVSVFLNTSTSGTISFSAATDFAMSSTGYGRVLIFDVDMDGKPDIGLVPSTNSQPISFLRNTSTSGSVSMVTQADVAVGNNLTHVNMGDLDGDGKPDITTIDGNPTQPSFHRNTTTGTTLSFSSSVSLSSAYYSSMFIGDFDADGRPEITALNNNGSSNSISVFRNIMAPPTVSSFAPTSAALGSTVTITGNYLAGATAVSFGGTAATSFTVVSPTSITAVVPACTSGSVSVTTPIGTANLAGFTFLPAPTITSFTPSSGPIGTSVVISGANFSATAANNTVFFGAVKATVTAATTNSLTVTVPAGATYQPISVTTGVLTAYSRVPFVVTFAGGGFLNSTSFDSGHDFTTGAGPADATISDIDGDGKSDVLVTNNNVSAGTSISILRNTTTTIISFANRVDFATLTAPSNITTGDIDGDGKPDVVVSHGTTTGYVSVFRNTSVAGSISFAARQDFSVGNYGNRVVLRDFDGDGRLDLVIKASKISVLRNTSTVGAISFAAKVDYFTTLGVQDFDAGDIDGDGKVDMILFNNGPSPFNLFQVSVFLNTSTSGTISFSAATDFATSSTALGRVLIFDVDMDGKPDIGLAPSNNSQPISFLRNTSTVGSVSMATQTGLAVGANLTHVSMGDLDGDGKPDITTIEGNPTQPSFHRNTTTGTTLSFGSSVSLSSVYYSSMFIGDFDGDGRPEITALNSSSNTISVFRNMMGPPTVTSFSPHTAGPGTVVTINGLNLDLALVSFGGVSAASVSTTPTKITAVVGAGATGQLKVTTGTGVTYVNGFHFFTGPVISSFSPVSGVAGSTVTINGSGFSSTAANNIVRFGTTTAQVTSATGFQLVVKVPLGATVAPITVTTGNLTGYSTETFAATSSKLVTLTNGTFVKNDVTVASNPQAIAAGDFDDDGKPDLAVINGTNLVSVFRNTSSVGNTTLGTGMDLTAGSIPVAITTGDFNLDGRLDIAVANSSTNTVSIFKNTSTSGAISFAAKVDFNVATNPQGISVGDLNGDARPDIVTSNFTGSNLVSVLLNSSLGDGNTSFAAKSDFTAGSFPTDVAIADLDGDDNAEMIVTNGNANNVTIFKNTITNGILSFQPKTLSTGTFPVSVAVGDITGDGWVDFVVANNSSSNVTVFRNLGDGALNFTQSNYATANGPWDVALGDMNGDGNNDINVACSSSNVVSSLKNSSANFSTKVDYPSGASTYGVVALDLDGDGTTDMATVNNTANSISLLTNVFVPQPVITSFTPVSAGAGATITITGTNFTGATDVSFGGKAATSFNVVSATSITAVVGTGTSGNVSVTTPGGTATLAGFTFVPTPSITSFSPAVGGPGLPIVITGTNFTGATGVSFGDVAAKSFTVTSSNSITAVVASTGASGNISITTPGGTAIISGFVYDQTITAVEPTSSTGDSEVEIFPNPSPRGEINFTLNKSWEGKIANINITDVSGRIVYFGSINCTSINSVALGGSTAPKAGLYILTLTSDKKNARAKVIVVD